MKILVFPLDEKNQYQHLLYFPIGQANKVNFLKIRPLFLPFLFVPSLFFYSLRGYSVFHLHWPSFNIRNKKKSKGLFKLNFFLSKSYIKSIKFLGFKLVWTIHNLVPHEKNTSNDLEITKLLCEVADAKIVHSNQTISEMKKLKLNVKNTFVIPHGSYVGVYSNNKKDTKRSFGFSKKDFVFLFNCNRIIIC